MKQPTEIVHTQECLRRQVEYETFVTRWPNYHRACGAMGYWHSPATFFEPEDGGPCSCVEEGFCPRCGEKSIIIDGDGVCDCTACGWSDRCFAERTPMPEGLICPYVDCHCGEEFDLKWLY